MSERDRAVARVLWVVLGANVLVAATKVVLGALSGSLALTADGLHSALDASSNVVGLVGLTLAAAPPDADHPYGHRRFETMAAVVIGLLIVAGMVEIVRHAVQAAVTRSTPRVAWSTVLGLALTIGVNVAISRWERREGQRLGSAILRADAGHTASDALGALAVLGGLGGVAVGWWWADLVAAGIVAALIARTAWVILSENLGVLADRARLDPHELHRVVLSVPGVRGAHAIRTRGSPDHVHVDLHVHLDPQMPLAQAHERTHAVVDALRARFPQIADVVVHAEPADGRERDLSRIAPR